MTSVDFFVGVCVCVVCTQEDEGAIMFANRVKREIAKRGGLVDLDWYVL